MNRLAKEFLEQEEVNRNLYIQGVIFKNNIALKTLNQKFNDFLFPVKLCGYIQKSISFTAIDIKKKENKIRERENLCLNVLDVDFGEERINTIPGQTLDFIEEIYEEKQYVDLKEFLEDEEVVQAIQTLTNRQKQIIYECIIKEREETVVAKELKISKPSVNKIKNSALNKLKKYLGGE